MKSELSPRIQLAPGALVKDGFLLVGVDEAPPAPLNFGLPGSPDFHGFEVDLTHAIADWLGLTIRYRSSLWSVILDDLVTRKLDMVCAAATITDERRKTFDFSDPYLDTSLAIVARDGHTIQSPRNLGGLTIGVRITTTAEQWVRTQTRPARVVSFHLNTEVYSALERSEVNAVIDDLPIASYFARSRPGLKLVTSIAGTEAQYGIAFAKENGLLRDAVNRIIHSLRLDGTLSDLRKRWLEQVPRVK